MKLPNLDEKVYEFDWKVFFGPEDGHMKKQNASLNFKSSPS